MGGRPLAKEVARLDLLLQVEVCRIGHERRHAGVAAATQEDHLLQQQ